VIHPTAEVERGAQIGANTRVWHFVHVRAGAIVGSNCTLGHGVFIDAGAVVGNDVKLQNRVNVYNGVTIEDGVFVGPGATFTNDRYPRAVTRDGVFIVDDWQPQATLVKYGASIGAAAVVLPDVTIGRWAMIGANTLVTRDVPDHGLVVGTPGRLIGYACRCGHRLQPAEGAWYCKSCDESYVLPALPEDEA
jgi:UDP-2-acetamido-3-amino-2,3-dideoxy-glucuronate N-acetyltransferase